MVSERVCKSLAKQGSCNCNKERVKGIRPERANKQTRCVYTNRIGFAPPYIRICIETKTEQGQANDKKPHRHFQNFSLIPVSVIDIGIFIPMGGPILGVKMLI